MKVLVAGATGFVGSRLVRSLKDAGHEVQALTRHPQDYYGAGNPVGGDVSDEDALESALVGCDAAYYLVHSLDSADFADKDAAGARTFGRAARAAEVQRIIYLGGLGQEGDDLSEHLRSRQEVEKLLGAAGVPVTTIRAGVIIGNGGLSWELMRELVAHLPIMITPRWVRTKAQPVAIADVVRYLTAALERPETAGEVYEIGGPEIMTYEVAMHRVARARHRPLVIVPVPLLTPKLSSRWLALVTSVDVQTATNLIASMSNEVVVQDESLRQLVGLTPTPFDEAVRQALEEREAQLEVQGADS
ncbi:MAG TPA: NAD(P)H-binding protein [Frankiaceae bacterium]|jgi:uncharacterized protein YbjT (DUF2867 family)|nr:NAD(P)H-binding protein [Frankiaceae bacterium]